MSAGGQVADDLSEGRKGDDDAAAQHHGDAGEHRKQHDDSEACQCKHDHGPLARGCCAFRRFRQCGIAHHEEALNRRHDRGDQFIGVDPVLAVIMSGQHLLFQPWRGPSKIDIERILQRLREPERTADLIHAGLDPLAIQVDPALATIGGRYFGRRQWTARTDRKRHRGGPAAGTDPQILGCAGDVQQRRQRRIGHRHLVRKTVQERFDDRGSLGHAGQEAFDHRSIAPTHGRSQHTIRRGANIAQLGRRLIEAGNERCAIANSEHSRAGVCERRIRHLHGLRNGFELSRRGGPVLE